MFEKGQSKCIWGEFYKVIDFFDVVVQVCFDLRIELNEGVIFIFFFLVYSYFVFDRFQMLGICKVLGVIIQRKF